MNPIIIFPKLLLHKIKKLGPLTWKKDLNHYYKKEEWGEKNRLSLISKTEKKYGDAKQENLSSGLPLLEFVKTSSILYIGNPIQVFYLHLVWLGVARLIHFTPYQVLKGFTICHHW